LIILCVSFLVAQLNSQELKTPEFPKITENTDFGIADYKWELSTLAGDTILLSQFKNKVIFINLWTTWCAPCVTELYNIQQLYDSLKTDDISFLVISDQKPKIVKTFLKEKQFSLPFYLQEPWWLDKIPGVEFVFTGGPKVFRTWGIPTTFIIDKNGKIVFKQIGAAKWDDASCIDFIRALLQK